jgi:TRAP-type C4-dicarboxylate transport system substrate-binding protein
MPPDDQARIRNRMQWFRSLPPERRQELRERWNTMTPDQRKQFIERMQRRIEQRRERREERRR